MGKPRLIDLSVTTVSNPPGSLIQSEISYISHEESAKIRGKALNLPKGLLPDNRLAAEEIATISTHAGTHLDSPWHYAPTSEGKPSRSIEEIPLEWCYSNGVVLDFTKKRSGDLISAADVQNALRNINYELQPFDIVLIRTDASKYYGKPGYESMHPGMGRESTLWLTDQGIKVMGIDAWGWDRPFKDMIREFEGGAKDVFWAGHFAGKEREYCHLENLANLDQLPMPYGFKVAVFPVKLKRCSAGWVRAVAILDQ